ncbi:MAG: molybdopterin converting factor subunit 1 [Candidatus Handelsmanbacteria bacterium]|nr:molybdopterin converting factor subunit 1 [Candidatus Handelsmanbacteria bacterium]
MKILVLLFASCRDAVGAKQLMLELAEGTTAAELREELALRYPKLAPLKEKLVVAANAEYIDGDAVLKDGDEVALIPPVSGGRN